MPKPTHPTNQARHWFSSALLSAMLASDSTTRAGVELALAFPDKPRYRDLIERSAWALRLLEIQVYLISESGEMRRAIIF